MHSDTSFSKTQLQQLDTQIKKDLKITPDPPQMEPWGAIVLFITIVFVFVWGLKQKRKKPLGKSHIDNLKSAAGWFAAAAGIFFSLSRFKIIHMKDWMISDGDLLILFSIIIALIGCVWAIYARIDAERAFIESHLSYTESKLAHSKSAEAYEQAKATYESFGTSFDFGDIFKRGTINQLIGKIGQSNVEIYLYLGFPVIGLFANEKFEEQEPLRHFLAFYTALEQIPSNHTSDFKLTMYVLSRERAIAWMNEKNLPVADQLYAKVIDFYDKIIPMITENPKVLVSQSFREEERLRFILIQNTATKDWDGQTWVVKPYFNKEEGFDSAGFSTKDRNIARVLTSIMS